MPLQSFHFCERTPALKGVVLFLAITCHQLSAEIRTWCFTSFKVFLQLRTALALDCADCYCLTTAGTVCTSENTEFEQIIA